MMGLDFLWSLGLAQAFARPSLGTEDLLLGSALGIWENPVSRTNQGPPAVVFGGLLGIICLGGRPPCSLLVMGLFNQSS